MAARHLHSPELALGMADAAQDAGVEIYERSAVLNHIAEGDPAIVQTRWAGG